MPKLSKFFIYVALVLFCNNVFALKVSVPQNIASNLSVSVYDISKQSNVYNYKATTPRLIASNMKLLTTYVGLDKLGKDFKWQTQVGYTGSLSGETLNGDLVIIGGGDPTLSLQDLSIAVNQLKIKKITGNIVYSNQYFLSHPKSSELYPEPYAEYSAEPNGLLINQGLTKVTLNLGIDSSAKLSPSQFADYTVKASKITIDNKCNCACVNPDSYIQISAIKKTLYPQGRVPASRDGKSITFYAPDSNIFTNLSIASVFGQSGIKYESIIANKLPLGKVKIVNTKYSESLGAIIYTMNQQSNNLYAKTIFMTSGIGESKQTDFKQSQSSYLATLNKNFKFNELNSNSLENGSGLSRHEKLTTQHMIQLLNNMYNSSNKNLVLDSLPTPGDRNNTLGNDFTNYAQMLYVKTGTLADVKAYSGYFINQQGNVYSVSFVLNNLNNNKTKSQQLNEFKQLIQDILEQLNKSS